MAKKTVSLFEVKDKEILILKENLSKLTSSDNEQIAFYVNTLGFEVKFVEPEPKKKNYFTIEKATEYIKEHDKKSLKEFAALKAEADKLAATYKSLKAAQKKAEAENATDEDKKNAPKEADVKAAQKAQIVAQREAFAAQKEYFKTKYGKEAYDTVRMM